MILNISSSINELLNVFSHSCVYSFMDHSFKKIRIENLLCTRSCVRHSEYSKEKEQIDAFPHYYDNCNLMERHTPNNPTKKCEILCWKMIKELQHALKNLKDYFIYLVRRGVLENSRYNYKSEMILVSWRLHWTTVWDNEQVMKPD